MWNAGKLVYRRLMAMLAGALLIVGCGNKSLSAVGAPAPAAPAVVVPDLPTPSAPSMYGLPELQRDYERMSAAAGDKYGPGGQEVLRIAWETLLRGKSQGRWRDVGLEDLWAHAIKEGWGLFNKPERRWGSTGPEETKDLIGQTTIGPFQITLNNVQNVYGHRYGIDPSWEPERVYTYMKEHPEYHVAIAADIIQLNYDRHGRRTPAAIQSYFWLEAFAKGDIGRGPWDKSVLASAPSGDWRDLTPEMKANTGFYGKQILLGTGNSADGLLYWLWVTGKRDEIRDILGTWKSYRRLSWDAAANDAVADGEAGAYAVREIDLRYLCEFRPEACSAIAAMVAEQ